MDKDQREGPRDGQPDKDTHNQQPARSSAFKEPANRDQKSTQNPEEMADLEQERKEALTERD